jgi:hypothetical protein
MSRAMEVAFVRMERGKDVNRWIVDDCPFCGKRHYHGAGTPDMKEPILGGRQSHCSPGGQYLLQWDGES